MSFNPGSALTPSHDDPLEDSVLIRLTESSYYPIMAHLAETTHILRVKNRSGNVHDGKAGLPFLRALWPQLASLRTGGARLRFRMDGAFFRQDVLRWLQGRTVGYAIKVPFYRWLDLQHYIRDNPTWVPVAPGVTGFAVPHAETPWQIRVAVTIYRKKVHHRATKNYQLDLFDPNDGHYEYSAVTSNLSLTVRNLWYFACGRGNHEKTIAQLKTGLAFHSVPTQTYAANSAWQQLVVLAHNLLTNFQLETGAPPRRRTRKHTVVPLLQSVQTLRFELFHRAALLVRPGCFRHQLLLPRPYLVLTKPLRLDIHCQRGASVKIGWKYLDD